jgi:hypothetical protein
MKLLCCVREVYVKITNAPNSSKFKSLIADLQKLLEEEYCRGQSDAAAHISSLVTNRAPFDTSRTNQKIAERAPKSTTRILVVKRAPKGTARMLVNRVLKSGPHTIAQICAAARTDTERLATYQTVRLELEKGKKEKKYQKVDGRWSFIS